MLEYQRHGISIKSSHQISFNNLCNHYQLPENPLKAGGVTNTMVTVNLGIKKNFIALGGDLDRLIDAGMCT